MIIWIIDTFVTAESKYGELIFFVTFAESYWEARNTKEVNLATIANKKKIEVTASEGKNRGKNSERKKGSAKIVVGKNSQAEVT